MDKSLVVIALGGNAILQPGQRGTFAEQYANVERTCAQLAQMVLGGRYKIVITHGNGPQVGNLLLQNELAQGAVSPMPLDACGAQSQGLIGYMIQQALQGHFAAAGRADIPVATVVTQVVVDAKDPAFDRPTKPVGPFYPEAEARRLEREKGYALVEDAGRGWRRVVPSPQPLEICEKEVIRHALAARDVIIASGGGGIPVVREGDRLRGVEAVIDKDLAGEVLARQVEAEVLLILTDVPQVKLHYGTPRERALAQVTVPEAERYLAERHFAAGSMAPKVQACLRFVRTGRRAIIAALDQALAALEGRAGTTFLPD